MKKLLALLLALMMCVAVFAACANETKDPGTTDEPGKTDEPGNTEDPGKTDEPSKPEDPATTKENYIVVANDEWTIVTYYELSDDPKPASWISGTSGLTGYAYGGVANLAPEGSIVAVKIDKLDAYASGDIAEEEMIFIEQDDTDGKFVGTEIEIEFNADKTVKSFKATGKSVVGELTITKEGDKYTAKIGDKVFLDKADASAKLATKAFDSILASGYYVSSATKKSVFASNSAENIDLQVLFGNDERDITTVGLFYDEVYNFNYEGGVDGYDWDGDGKLDLVVVNRPHTVKATADSDGTSVSFGVLGDNHSYCGCGGWHTQTTVSTGTIAAGIVKNDILFVYEDYKIGSYNVTKPEVIKAKLESVDIAGGKATIGGKTYNLYNAGDLPYLNSKPVTQYETEAQSALWNNSVGVEVSVVVDKLGNIVWAAVASEAQVVDAAWALEKGATLGTHTLTGKITSVDTPYSEQYKNITVTIVVGDKADKPIVCYRVKGEGVEGLAVGDTITVSGELLRYADKSELGLVEFNSTAVVTKIVKGEGTTPAPHEHAWDAGKVTKEATCKEEGVKTFTCECGETKTEKIAKTTAHTYKDGVCSVCGAKDPNYVAPVADTYLVVANDKWSIIASGEIEVTGGETMGTNGIAYAKCNYNKDYIVASDIADDFNFLIVIKLSDVAAYKAGTLDESKILLVPQEDEAGTWVGQEVTVEFNADKTPKAVKKTGKSVVGEVTISESNGKYTVKVGDTVYLNGADASAKLATSALEYLTHNNTYFVTRNKFRPFVGQQVMVDLQVIFGNAEFDVTKVGNFYNEFINLNRNMVKVVGYDWDGDKALDAVVLNDATCVKVGAGALSANGDLAIQICSSNMGYYKDGWWNGGTVNKANLVMDSSLTVAEGDYVMLMGDHMTQTTTVTLTGEVTGVLSAVDWEKKTITIGGTVYGMACDGEGPYGYALNKTRWDWPDYNWASLLNTEITVRTDGKYVCVTLK